jgi:hypothetical protein
MHMPKKGHVQHARVVRPTPVFKGFTRSAKARSIAECYLLIGEFYPIITNITPLTRQLSGRIADCNPKSGDRRADREGNADKRKAKIGENPGEAKEKRVQAYSGLA